MKDTENKLEACRSARSWAAKSFHTSFSQLLSTEQQISEALLRDQWLLELRKNPDLFPDGWYIPPLHGIGVLFGTEDNYQRMNYKSLRPEEIHPKEDILLNRKKGIVYVYASPVDKRTGMIGDWGMTIYFGKDPDIIKHLQQCLNLNYQVLDYAQAGMIFAHVTKYATNLFSQQNLSNQVTSTTDIAGVNIGHTVPASYEQWSPEELEVFKRNNWEEILKIISKKRKFLNPVEPLPIQPGMAFTIEQRLTRANNSRIPMSSFHTIALFHTDGKKELLTDFSEIFKLVGMDYMLTEK